MIEVQVTKEKGYDRMLGDRYSMSVSVSETIATQHIVSDCMTRMTREMPQDYIIERMVDEIASSFRDKLRLQVSCAMSRQVKQVWSN